MTRTTEIEPIPIPVDIPEGFWERDLHYPAPLSPAYRSLWLPALNEGFQQAMTEFGFLVDTVEQRDLGGWIYTRIVPMGGKERPSPPAWLLWLMLRIHPTLRARCRKAEFERPQNLARSLLEDYYTRWRVECLRLNTQAQEIQVDLLNDTDLLEHLEHVLQTARKGAILHIRLSIPHVLLLYQLVKMLRDFLGWEQEKVYALLSGSSKATTHLSEQLDSLLTQLQALPELEHEELGVWKGRAYTSFCQRFPQAAKCIDAWLEVHGYMMLGYDLEGPMLKENPGLLLGLLEGQLHTTRDKQKAQSHCEALLRDVRNRLSNEPEKLAAFEACLAQAKPAYHIRDDNGRACVSVPMALVRRALLACGQRLVQRGALEHPEHIFFLEVTEVKSALEEHMEVKERVVKRRGQRLWAEQHPGPASYGIELPPPPFKVFPPGSRFLLEAVNWSKTQHLLSVAKGHDPKAVKKECKGIGASAGSYTGKARVILKETDFDRLRAGEILVCPCTTPNWSILFGLVGALVTDKGGLLSHPAIIAREYHIPAVLGTGDATRRIVDGQIVTVDGNLGIVSLEQ